MALSKFNSKWEAKALACVSLAYVVLSTIGSVFGFQVFQVLYDQPSIYIPAFAFFLFLASRIIISLVDEVEALNGKDNHNISFIKKIRDTYTETESIAKDTNKTKWHVTYLNPEAFAKQEPLTQVKSYWKKIEQNRTPDYKRIFGIYPDTAKYKEKRKNTLEWLLGHKEGTAELNNYCFRVLELETHHIDMSISENAAHISFPYAKTDERGVTFDGKEEIEALLHHFQNLWESASSMDELLQRNTEQNA